MSPSDLYVAVVAACLVAGGLIWLPAAVRVAREARQPVATLRADVLGPPGSDPAFTIVPNRVNKFVPHGTNYRYGTIGYQLHVGSQGEVSFVAPASITIRKGDLVTISYHAETSQVSAVTNHAHGATWRLPSSVPGPLHPLAPFATVIAAIGVPFAALAVFGALLLDAMTDNAATVMERAESASNAESAQALAMRAEGTDIVFQLMPFVIVPIALSLIATVALCRRTYLRLPAMVVRLSPDQYVVRPVSNGRGLA